MRAFQHFGFVTGLLMLGMTPLHAAECDPYANYACLNAYSPAC